MILYSRNSIAQDVDGNLTKLTTTGPEQDSVKTYDQNTQQLLENIYNQLKMLNFQMATITENWIEDIGE